MARNHKIAVRLTDAEYWYLRRHAIMCNRDAVQVMRDALHEYVIAREGDGVALHLLRGSPPSRTEST